MDNEKVIVEALAKRAKPRVKMVKGKTKRKKLEKLSTIQNRLMKLWLQRTYDIYDHKCAICGDPVKPNAHHIVNRDISPALRFDPNNSIALCSRCHKFSLKSAHKNGVWFASWLREHAPMQHDYILSHTDDRINIRDREVLYKLEANLKQPITSEERLFHGQQDDQY